MKYTIITTCFLFLVTGFSSCKKYIPGTPHHPGGTPTQNPPLTKTQMLTKGSWKVVAKAYRFVGQTEYKDNYLAYAECVRDNLFNYLPDKTFTETVGAIKCNATEQPVVVSRTWELIDDSTRIRYKDQYGYFWYSDILELTDSTLKLRDKNDITIERISTYKH